MRTLTVLCAFVALLSFAVAQTPQSKPVSPFEQELIANQNQFMQALEQKNAGYVKESVADDFHGIGSNGDFYDKEELVGSAQEGMPKGLRVYDIVVVRLNEESAVVSYNLIVPGSRLRYRHMSDTWAKDGGKWKLKFQQITANLWSATDFD
ncbi:MAG TPA: nuclear transport factor 2 family protein [Terriglobales bacterium]|nr:nuclear transport factor 2 family protein [Terriglobales bacterium]